LEIKTIRIGSPIEGQSLISFYIGYDIERQRLCQAYGLKGNQIVRMTDPAAQLSSAAEAIEHPSLILKLFFGPAIFQ
jgi:hypothetical protein